MDRSLVETLSLGGNGPRFVAKDSFDIAGRPTRMGSAALDDAAPAACHAAVVQALLDAGCALVGKANMHELAYGVTGVNPRYGTPPNPRFPDRIPGGSSSGSASAVAAGLAEFALGADTGGSIRMPAACCGVFGLKPTFGRISRRGVHPAETSLDCVGPIAAEAEMLARVMAMMDASFRPQGAPAGLRLGLAPVEAEAPIAGQVRALVEMSGLSWMAAPLPSFRAAYDAGLTLISAEAWSAYGRYIDHPGLGADVAARLRRAALVGPDQIAAAEAVRRAFTAQVDGALEGADLLVLPTLPAAPPRLDDLANPALTLQLTALVRPFNVSGHPAATVPFLLPSGLPGGLQIVGRKGEDELVCAAAQLFGGLAKALNSNPSFEE